MKYVFALVVLLSSPSFAGEQFYKTGDGNLSLKSNKNGKTFKGSYRNEDGSINPDAIQKINDVFGVPEDFGEDVSYRTISWIDFLEDMYAKGSTLLLYSGYRSPAYNEKLREGGALAGKTSYHMEAMAADLVFPGVSSKKIWDYAKSLNYGGVGYYDGTSVHIDSGKPRSWTAETAIDPKEGPPLNKNIYLSVDKDIYHPGEPMRMFFSAISNYPFGIKNNMKIVDKNQNIWKVFPAWNSPAQEDDCVEVLNRTMARRIDWQIPEKLPKNELLSIEVEYCEPMYEKMPPSSRSREFEIR